MSFPSIPGHTLERCIGKGGMGAVYLAKQNSLGRRVAVKVMLASLMEQDDKFAERFDREAKTTAGLRHPNIITVYDSGEFDGRCFITMDYLEGGSLKDRIRSGLMTRDDVLRTAIGICAGLGHAHMAGLVHRDIKPENIMLDRAGNPVITDFGIVKVTEGSSELTGTHTVGSPTYMSPEQLMGDASIDGRADLYSLGVVLFEMLEGRPPFESEGAYGVGMKHMNLPPPPLSMDNAEFQPIVGRLLEKNRDKRYGTAAELMVALRRLEAGEAVEMGYEPVLTPREVPRVPTAPSPDDAPTRLRHRREEAQTVIRPGNAASMAGGGAAAARTYPVASRRTVKPFEVATREIREPHFVERLLGSNLFRLGVVALTVWIGWSLFLPEVTFASATLEARALFADPAEKQRIANRLGAMGLPSRQQFWVERAAAAGNPGSSYQAALSYRRTDEVRTISLLEAELSNPANDSWDLPSAILLGETLCNGRGFEDCSRARSVLEGVVHDHADARAMLRLGEIHLERLQPADYASALSWFTRTVEADGGGPPSNTQTEDAMLNIARMYDEGLGVEADPQRATQWIALAAQGPVAKSLTRLTARERCADARPAPAACRDLPRRR